jgi:hypothetical protein
MQGGLNEIVVLPVGQERGERSDQDRAGDGRREQGDDGTGRTVNQPAEARAEREKICAGRNAAERKRQ